MYPQVSQFGSNQLRAGIPSYPRGESLAAPLLRKVSAVLAGLARPTAVSGSRASY
jgi:hypothetical protein